MSFHRVFVGFLAVTAGIGGAIACGPDFPWQLLDDRQYTVSAPVGFTFADEVLRLAGPSRDDFQAVERDAWEWHVDPQEAVTAERQEALSGAYGPSAAASMTPDQLLDTLDAARKAPDGNAAIQVGAGLPRAVLLYVAGAIEFRASRFDAAERYFRDIGRLPTEQGRIRIVAASYMQGRIHQQRGALAAARAAFQAARRHVLAGAPDPMGLAVSSFGQEARLDLIEAGLVKATWPVPPPGNDPTKTARLSASAVRLYAEQAARGSKIAILSLRDVAALLLSRREGLDLQVGDPMVRRLLVAYAVARMGEFDWQSPEDKARGPAAIRVIEAVLAQPDPPVDDDIDRLAALAYLAGRYDAAERLTATTVRPLGLWVRAKLAMRRDDRAAAVRDWTAALASAESVESGEILDGSAKARLRGELAVVTLSQGDYGGSLRLLFPVADDYWGDVAYIAERVLTVDELKSFVDSLPSGPVQAASGRSVEPELRALLARRLIRDGRIREALPYFSPAGSLATTSDIYDSRAYLAAVEDARPGWPLDWPWQQIFRAEALFKVAMITRGRGMELMGTEGPPDEAVMGGMFPGGIGQSSLQGAFGPEGSLLGPDEANRFIVSAPKPDVRFHYRVIATDRALEAADLLPERSQAYAATLCWAARFAADSSDPDRFSAIYKRYVATGPYQSWAVQFGQICPKPDFVAARSFWLRRIATWPADIAHSLWRHKFDVIAALLTAAALVAGLAWFARRPTGHSEGR